MLKKILYITIYFIVIISSNSLAQEKLGVKSYHNFKKTIMIVPFDPKIYSNDATSIIALRDSISPDEILFFFREKLHKQLSNGIKDSCHIFSFISSNTKDDQEELTDLYSSIQYELMPCLPNKINDAKNSRFLNFFEKAKKEKEEEKRLENVKKNKTKIQNGEIIRANNINDQLFLNIVFKNPKVLREFAKSNKIDYFLFINQFEIKGNYGDPYISGNLNAKRSIKVHYSIYDNKGKLFHGGLAKNLIPFDLDNKQEIVDRYFPKIIRHIIKNIPFKDL